MDAVTIGLGAMLGAGVFVAFAPAAAAAGPGLPLALLVAALVAFCNALSSARLAARYPESGGTYVYGRHQLGAPWGWLAGWSFVVGKIASSAAVALTVGAYLWPSLAHPVAALVVAAVTAVDYFGVTKSLWATRVIVAVVLIVLAVAIAASLTGGAAGGDGPGARGAASGLGAVSALGVLQGAGFLFFAFAGYARIATMGEEVRDPQRTIPRAIVIALAIVLLVYAALTATLLVVLGPGGIAATSAPLHAAVARGAASWLLPVVDAGAAVAAVGSLLALLLGISRTVLAMGRTGDLPRALAAIHPRSGVPQRAQLIVGALVASLALLADLRTAIGFSSFGVLVYYAIANLSALRLGRDEGRPPLVRPLARPLVIPIVIPIVIPLVGLLGCLAIAAALPPSSTLPGLAVLLLGVLIRTAVKAIMHR
jgi:APA family basic amino acid/polyamine antiporter